MRRHWWDICDLHLDLDNLLGKKADLDEGASRELDVETGVHIDSSGHTEHEIEGEGGTDIDLKQTWHGDLQLLRGDELDRLVEGGAGRQVDFKVGLEAAEADGDG